MLNELSVEETKKLVNEVYCVYRQFLFGDDEIDIKKDADKVTVKIKSMQNHIDIEYCISQTEWDSFISKLYDDIHINNWKTIYNPEKLMMMDGARWEIQISFDGGEKRIYKGDNTYPYNWDDFTNLLVQFM